MLRKKILLYLCYSHGLWFQQFSCPDQCNQSIINPWNSLLWGTRALTCSWNQGVKLREGKNPAGTCGYEHWLRNSLNCTLPEAGKTDLEKDPCMPGPFSYTLHSICISDYKQRQYIGHGTASTAQNEFRVLCHCIHLSSYFSFKWYNWSISHLTHRHHRTSCREKMCIICFHSISAFLGFRCTEHFQTSSSVPKRCRSEPWPGTKDKSELLIFRMQVTPSCRVPRAVPWTCHHLSGKE